MNTTTARAKCAVCHEAHPIYVRQMPDGSSHVYMDAATLARRNAATTDHKVRFNALWDAAHAKGRQVNTKDQLTERRRGKGGTLVRVVRGKWAGDEVMVVKDLMDRKSWNKPNRVGIGPLNRGVAFGVALDEIELA